MSFHNTKLPHYLRTHRRRAGFSQDEVAFLLGGRDGAAVSRYEHFRRLPNPGTMLALEVIYRVPARELFAGHFEQVERDVRRRAKRLARTLAGKPDRLAARKQEVLLAICGGREPTRTA